MDQHISRAPTMNINPSSTLLNSSDPLKKLFTKLFNVLPSSSRGHVVAVIGEFLGTIVFLVLAFAGVETASASSNKQQGPDVSTATKLHTPEQLLYIALAAGFSLAITAWTFFRISGGLFNPVVSLQPFDLAKTSSSFRKFSPNFHLHNRSRSGWHSLVQSLGSAAYCSSFHSLLQQLPLPTSYTLSSMAGLT